MHNICIIPARKGSKRIKGKNIKNFFKKPMIEYSIIAAKKSKCFREILVSTDCERIAKIARKLGANVPNLRPKKLASDYVPVGEVISYTIKNLSNLENIDFVCNINAASPLISEQYIKKGLKIIRNHNYDYVFGVKEFESPIQRSFSLNKDNLIKKANVKFSKKRSQDLEKKFYDSGQFYWAKPNVFIKNKNLFKTKAYGLKIPYNFSYDINNKIDLEISKMIFRFRKK